MLLYIEPRGGEGRTSPLLAQWYGYVHAGELRRLALKRANNYQYWFDLDIIQLAIFLRSWIVSKVIQYEFQSICPSLW